jgi:excisionase family DNA binding protein
MTRRLPVSSPPESDRLLTTREVARLLNISRSLTYELVVRGELPAVHVGGVLRFLPQDIDAFIHRSSAPPSRKRKRRR